MFHLIKTTFPALKLCHSSSSSEERCDSIEKSLFQNEKQSNLYYEYNENEDTTNSESSTEYVNIPSCTTEIDYQNNVISNYETLHL